VIGADPDIKFPGAGPPAVSAGAGPGAPGPPRLAKEVRSSWGARQRSPSPWSPATSTDEDKFADFGRGSLFPPRFPERNRRLSVRMGESRSGGLTSFRPPLRCCKLAVSSVARPVEGARVCGRDRGGRCGKGGCRSRGVGLSPRGRGEYEGFGAVCSPPTEGGRRLAVSSPTLPSGEGKTLLSAYPFAMRQHLPPCSSRPNPRRTPRC